MALELIVPTKYAIAWTDRADAQPVMFLCPGPIGGQPRPNWASPKDGHKPYEFASVGMLLAFIANMRQFPDASDHHFTGDGRFMVMMVYEKAVVTKTYVPALG